MTTTHTRRRVLVAAQFSRLESQCRPIRGHLIDAAHYVDADGSRHNFSGWVPGVPADRQPHRRRWVPARYAETWPGGTWADLAAAFPDHVRDVDADASPAWGSAWYVPGPDGFPELWRENWDTSD